MFEITQSILTLIGLIVTAVATVMLWRVTAVLAAETRRLAIATAQPQIIVTVEPNPWSTIHADLRVANCGNAPAFDIKLSFDPPLEPDRENASAQSPLPFQNVSILRPGQVMTSWIGRFFPFIEKTYHVTASWRRTPDGDREELAYDLSISDYKDSATLGSGDPSVDLAQRFRKFQEDAHKVFNGNQKIGVDIYDQQDRIEHERVLREMWSDKEAPSLSQESDP